MMRRVDREKDSAFAIQLLHDCEYAILATVNEDGTPYCIPISPVLSDEKTIYFHCALQGKKLDNIARCGAVCLTCVGRTKLVPEKFSTEFESAVATGSCTQVSETQEKILALRLICEKYAATNMDAFDQAIKASLPRTGIYKISLQAVTGKAKKYPSKGSS